MGGAKHYYFRGETKTLRAFAEQYGIPVRFVWSRMRRGWTLEEALTTPEGESSITPYYAASRKCAGCRYAKKMVVGRYTDDYYCDYLLMCMSRRPVRFEDCRGWDKGGRWRGPGPEPQEDKQETNRKGG